MYNFLCLLEHRHLILTHRYDRSLKRRNVRRLADRIGKESNRDARLEITHLDLGLHRRITLQSGHSNQVHIVKGKLA